MWLQVIDCRRVLKYTYVLGFFLADHSPEKQLFEHHQVGNTYLSILLLYILHYCNVHHYFTTPTTVLLTTTTPTTTTYPLLIGDAREEYGAPARVHWGGPGADWQNAGRRTAIITIITIIVEFVWLFIFLHLTVTLLLLLCTIIIYSTYYYSMLTVNIIILYSRFLNTLWTILTTLTTTTTIPLLLYTPYPISYVQVVNLTRVTEKFMTSLLASMAGGVVTLQSDLTATPVLPSAAAPLPATLQTTRK